MEIKVKDLDTMEIVNNGTIYTIKQEKGLFYLYAKYEGEDFTYYIRNSEKVCDLLLQVKSYMR